jgi:class 3 adenylate cyclase
VSTTSDAGRRKLIAVLYADMVGYSRLIGLDDAGTLERLRALRRSLFDPAIEEHGGNRPDWGRLAADYIRQHRWCGALRDVGAAAGADP